MYKAPQQQTVCQHLFNHLYFIEMQHRFYYTDEHRQVLPGMNGPSSDDEQLEMWLNDTISLQRTAVQLVALHDEGIPFMIVYPKDLLTIYQKFNQHLFNWKNKLEQPFCAKRPPPPSDFLKIQNFMFQIGHVAESIARQQHFLGNGPTKLTSEEIELWDFMGSLASGFNYKQPTLIERQNSQELDIRYLEPPVNMQEVWEKSSWSRIFAEEMAGG